MGYHFNNKIFKSFDYFYTEINSNIYRKVFFFIKFEIIKIYYFGNTFCSNLMCNRDIEG